MANTFIAYPENAPKSFNACTDPCDMLQGPCACGSWHTKDQWNAEVLSCG